MPQMMPMNWTFMFILINIIMMTTMTMLYYNTYYFPPFYQQNKLNNQPQWMW